MINDFCYCIFFVFEILVVQHFGLSTQLEMRGLQRYLVVA